MKLSTYLTLEEATRSQTAKRNGLSNEVTNPEHLENLKWLAKTVYDPLKFEFPEMLFSGTSSKTCRSIRSFGSLATRQTPTGYT